MANLKPTLLPLGDAAILVRFAEKLDLKANTAAITLARQLVVESLPGVLEITPNLGSVLVRYNPARTTYEALAGELRLIVSREGQTDLPTGKTVEIPTSFGNEFGPDLEEVSNALGMSVEDFIKAHNQNPLQVLATGFAPGFVYCGMHDDTLKLPRRQVVRDFVPAGTILFAANQTAITATAMPTGWHAIGRTTFNNFDPSKANPTQLDPGDLVVFREITT